MIATCPTPDQLSAFHIGKLSSEELEGVAAHVDSCPQCLATLDGLSDQTDPFLSELRQPAKSLGLSDTQASRVSSLVEAIGVQFATLGVEAAANVVLPEAPRPVELGQLGQYELLEKLGEGGMGQVFKARHRLMERVVALKVIHKELLDHPGAVQRFQREIRALARLSHPNIVRAEYADQVGDTHFLVMEFIEGRSLNDLVRKQGPLPISLACGYLAQAAEALQHAHEQGLIHRDVKPSNLLVTPAGQVKVLDLGLARFQEDQPLTEELTAAGQVMGTPDYMAPEQWEDTHGADIRADIYSLGCTLYHLLAGQPPFSGPEYNTFGKKVKAHATKPVPPIRQLRSEIPDGLVAVLDRSLAKEPAKRHATPGALSAALQPFCATRTWQVPAEATDVSSAQEPPRTLTAEPRNEAPAAETGSHPRRAATVREHRRWRVRGSRVAALALAGSMLGIVVLVSVWWQWKPSDSRYVAATGDMTGAGSARSTPSGNGPSPSVVTGAEVIRATADTGDLLPPGPALKLVPAGPQDPAVEEGPRNVAARMDPPSLIRCYFQHFRGEAPVLLGELGSTSFKVRYDDDLKIQAQFKKPAHCYLIAYNPDGKEQLLWPRRPDGKGDDATPPPLAAGLTYPPKADNFLALNDGVGMQAFVLAASAKPLPAFQEWKKLTGAAPWRAFEAKGIWQYDRLGFTHLPLTRGTERYRDTPVHSVPEAAAFFWQTPDTGFTGVPWALYYGGPPKALLDLCEFYRAALGVETIQVFAFPVRKKE